MFTESEVARLKAGENRITVIRDAHQRHEHGLRELVDGAKAIQDASHTCSCKVCGRTMRRRGVRATA